MTKIELFKAGFNRFKLAYVVYKRCVLNRHSLELIDSPYFWDLLTMRYEYSEAYCNSVWQEAKNYLEMYPNSTMEHLDKIMSLTYDTVNNCY